MCDNDQFTCMNIKNCVPRKAVCNGKNDCVDRTDETSCESPIELGIVAQKWMKYFLIKKNI